MTVPYRPLGLVTSLVESVGLEVTHSYEDLVFIEHNAFLLQMGEQGEEVLLHFNVDAEPGRRDDITAMLSRAGRPFDLVVRRLGTFRMAQAEESENIVLEFLAEQS